MYLAIFMAFLFIQQTSYAAETVDKSLEEAHVLIISDGAENYDIKQSISLIGEGDFSGQVVEHTFSTINDMIPENLQFIANGNPLEYTIEEFDALTKYFVSIPDGISENFDYEVNYSLSVENGDFRTPLFVPIHAAEGEKNIVTIDFKTTEENMVQRNSFPVLKKSEDNEVTSYLMNIPSHVTYIFGTEKNIFNSHNIYSWTAIFALLLIVFVWIRSEIKTTRLKGKEKNGKGVVQ